MESNKAKTHLFISLFVVHLFCAVALGQSGKKQELPALQSLLESLENQHADMRTLAVQYRQEKNFSFLEQPVISYGFILFSTPNNVRYDITEPFQSCLLKNGKKINRYEYRQDQWHELEFSGGKSIQLVIEQIGLWMQGRFNTQQDFFSLTMTADDPNGFASLHLKPRHESFRKYIRDIQIRISEPPQYKIKQIDIFESGEDCFSLIFTKELKDISLPASCFDDPGTDMFCRELFVSKKKETKN